MSIASRITSMQEHIGDIYDTLELGGADLTNTNKNLVNIEPILKQKYLDYMNNGTQEIWNNWEKVTGTGSDLELNNTVQAPMNLGVGGNSEQIQYSGKNLVNFDSYSNTSRDSLSTLRLVVSLGNQQQTVYTNNEQTKGTISFSFVPNSNYTQVVIKHNGSTQDLRQDILINLTSGTTYYMTLDITENNPSVAGGFKFNKVMISTTGGDYEPYVRSEQQVHHHLIHNL